MTTLLNTMPIHPLAQLNWDVLNTDLGYPLALMGMFVVFAALILMSVFIGSLPRIMAFLHQVVPERVETPKTEPAALAAEESDAIPEETLAIIAAVVADIVGPQHRIVRTRQVTPQDMNWALEGRLRHHASHRIRTRDPRKS